ncbi:MAG TPA: hypothetical protein DDW84_00185 [Phycisphaerales bacterium]|nr:MAG: hypothetical protein A2Y13_01970 [Planctomycetes bacterium GWC2_45_44]HBG77255.1 hypothetical protein [Phycisphaerales bacterium]HBR19188.1 hypothetical protein [Phycisphaerales bacterium]
MAATTLDALEIEICKAIASVTGFVADNVINERNPGALPTGAYASWRKLDIEQQAYPEITNQEIAAVPGIPGVPAVPATEETPEIPAVPAIPEIPARFDETISDVQYIKGQIKIVGKDAFSKLSRFVTLLRSSNRFKDLWAVCGLGGADSVQDVSVVVNSRSQEQAIVNVYFYAEIQQVSEVDYFDKAAVPITDYDLSLVIPKE